MYRNSNFKIDNEQVENVQSYTYLETLISSTGTDFSLALDKSKEKGL